MSFENIPLYFSLKFILNFSQLPNCRKIGEGVYGEVFMKKSLSDGEPVVLKIIPIEGHVLANGEPQKNYQEILPEIVISMELSNLRHGKDFMTNGFVNVKQVKSNYICLLFSCLIKNSIIYF